MSDKNIYYLKKAVYTKLSSDATLINLLGGNNIFHKNPPKSPVYPSVIYEVATDVDNPYNESDETGKITATEIRVSIFSDSSKSRESDNIEARIKALLNGQRTLNDSDIICYGCYRSIMPSQMLHQEQQIWITYTRYRAVWAPKS